jgi:DNA polymerase III subunit beta
MRIEVIQEKFSKALVHINKAVSNRPNIPVLGNVLISTEKGSIKLSSTNLEIGINATIGADVKEEGSVTVSAKLLSEFVSTLKSGKITIELKEKKLVVKSVDNLAEFFTIPAEDFPTVPMSDGSPMLSIPAVDFSRALDLTIFSASTDNSRPVLTGILMKITKRKLLMGSVDGFRLSHKEMKIESGPDSDYNEIVPAVSLSDVNKILKDMAEDEDMVEIYSLESNNQILFKIGDVELVSRIIEGEFPNYKDIMPVEKQNSFQILKNELANTVKVVGIFARNVVGNKTKFSINAEDKKLSLSAVVVDVGKNDSSADILNVEGGNMDTAYNVRYLQDFINSISGEEIVYESNGATAPGVFKDKSDKTYLHIIMPMRLE